MKINKLIRTGEWLWQYHAATLNLCGNSFATGKNTEGIRKEV